MKRIEGIMEAAPGLKIYSDNQGDIVDVRFPGKGQALQHGKRELKEALNKPLRRRVLVVFHNEHLDPKFEITTDHLHPRKRDILRSHRKPTVGDAYYSARRLAREGGFELTLRHLKGFTVYNEYPGQALRPWSDIMKELGIF